MRPATAANRTSTSTLGPAPARTAGNAWRRIPVGAAIGHLHRTVARLFHGPGARMSNVEAYQTVVARVRAMGRSLRHEPRMEAGIGASPMPSHPVVPSFLTFQRLPE